jgi:hypothetical protein
VVIDSGRIGLRQTIAAVRSELVGAMADGADSALRFDVGPVQLDLAVDVTNEVGGEAGVRVWVLSLSGGGRTEVRNSHRVMVTLNPVDAGSGTGARIAGREAAQPPRPSTLAG